MQIIVYSVLFFFLILNFIQLIIDNRININCINFTEFEKRWYIVNDIS